MKNRILIVKELLAYFWKNKYWWLVPFIVILILIGVLIAFANTSPIAPFIYTAF